MSDKHKIHHNEHSKHQGHHKQVHHKHQIHHKHKKTNHKAIITSIVIVLLIIVIFNLVQISFINNKLNEKVNVAKEAAKPAKIQIVTLIDNSCKDCFDIKSTLDSIKSGNVDVTKEDSISFKSVTGKQLINKYGIEKIPAIVVVGEIEKVKISSLTKKEDALIFLGPTPPYTDSSNGEIKGKVKLTYLKNSKCGDCVDLTTTIQGIKQSGVVIIEEKEIEFDSEEGKGLINKYGFDKVPALILSSDLEEYEIIQQWQQLGEIKNGDYVVTKITPPFYDLNENKVVGIIDLIRLTDKSCTECYDVNGHDAILARFGMKIRDENSYDISEVKGNELVEKYSITKVPTIILSEDAKHYELFQSVWQQVGSIEDDGAYVFRSVEVMSGSYKDLENDEIKTAQ